MGELLLATCGLWLVEEALVFHDLFVGVAGDEDAGGVGDGFGFLVVLDPVVHHGGGVVAVGFGGEEDGGVDAGGVGFLEFVGAVGAGGADADDALGVELAAFRGADGAEGAVVVHGAHQPV